MKFLLKKLKFFKLPPAAAIPDSGFSIKVAVFIACALGLLKR